MYDQSCHRVYNVAEVNHWNVVADPGHHAYKEALVSLVWNWEIKFGCYPKWQHLVPGDTVGTYRQILYSLGRAIR